jgi:putative sugar O-methyltransferase
MDTAGVLREPLQVADDQELLSLMMEDLGQAPPQYRPTNYWQYYQNVLVPALKQSGLRDFRRSRNPVLSSFAAVDLVRPIASMAPMPIRSKLLNNRITRQIPGWLAMLNSLKSALLATPSMTVHDSLTPEALRMLYYGYAENQGSRAAHAKPLSSVEMSLYGNPEDAFAVEGRRYSLAFLDKYLRYAYAARFVDFGKVKVFVELGSGSGKQAELLRKLHPDVCYLLFDIPPQLYVAHQYLSAVFPGSVVPYRETRALKTLNRFEPGKIYMFGTPQFPLLESVPMDLFWNGASFQEMEPDVVENYLSVVNRRASAVYLHELMEGLSVARKGEKGVLEPTTLAHYRRFLSSFELMDMAHGLPHLSHAESFWRRKG